MRILTRKVKIKRMGRLGIEGMKFHAYHGHYEEENIIGTDFLVDVYFTMSLHKAGETDSIKDTVNYEDIYQICAETMSFQYELIEKVAKSILDEIVKLLDRKKVEIGDTESIEVLVRVRKLNPPLAGPVAQSFVEIQRLVS